MPHDAGCKLCVLGGPRPDPSVGTIVYSDSEWHVGVMARRAVPGWLTVWPQAHVEGWESLPTDVASSYGVLLRDVARAVRTAVGFPSLYIAGFHETVRHVHTLIAGRPDEVTPDRRGAALLLDHDDLLDWEGAISIGRHVAQLLQRRRAGHPGDP